MKKVKGIMALVLALTMLAPTMAFAACSNEEATLPQTPPSAEQTPPTEENGTTPAPPETPDSGGGGDSENAPPVEPVVSYAQYIRCTGNDVNLRLGAGTGYAVVGEAHKGEIYAVVGKTGDWYKTYYRGKTVYISASYAAIFSIQKSENNVVEDVLSEGYQLLGVPYVYGAVRLHDGKGKLLSGFTAQKFDCSSLVQYMFYHGANELLQVTTRTQVSQGKYVHPSDLQRGDCIYFTNDSRQHLSGIERVGHVAVYLGNEYILHTASDYARIEKMSAKRWSQYIEARRFV